MGLSILSSNKSVIKTKYYDLDFHLLMQLIKYFNNASTCPKIYWTRMFMIGILARSYCFWKELSYLVRTRWAGRTGWARYARLTWFRLIRSMFIFASTFAWSRFFTSTRTTSTSFASGSTDRYIVMLFYMVATFFGHHKYCQLGIGPGNWWHSGKKNRKSVTLLPGINWN